MAYSDFTIKKVKEELGIKIIENEILFDQIQKTNKSELLYKILKRNIPLASLINTEQARSELFIINILLEIKDIIGQNLSLFSGIEFNVDKDKGLNGYCDYILSKSPEQIELSFL